MYRGKYRFPSLEMARDYLNGFVNKNKLTTFPDLFDLEPDTLVLWIYDLELTDEEIAKYFIGNYASIKIVQSKKGFFTFLLEKIPTEKPRDIGPRFPKINNEFLQKILKEELKFKSYKKIKEYVLKFVSFYTRFPKFNDTDDSVVEIVPDPNIEVLWIIDFDLTEEEVKNGYIGNYGKIIIYEDGDYFSVKLEKFPHPNHPRRNRPLEKHPDFGEPIIRNILNKRTYNSFGLAYRELEKLAQKYPKACVLKQTRSFVYIYSKTYRAEGHSKPIKSHIAEVVEDNGNFIIDLRLNDDPIFLTTRIDDESYSVFFPFFNEEHFFDDRLKIQSSAETVNETDVIPELEKDIETKED